MELYKRLLKCLQCPFADELNLASREHLLTLIVWLEDSKIRDLEIDERKALKTDSSDWNQNFCEYLYRLGCPFKFNSDSSNESLLDCVCWLVTHAVAVEYEDCSSECVGLEENTVNNTDDDNKMDVSDYFNNPEVDSLGSLLGMKRCRQWRKRFRIFKKSSDPFEVTF